MMRPNQADFVLYRCYAAGRPRPMKESDTVHLVSFYAKDCSERDPGGEYEVRGVLLHPEGREDTQEVWIAGKLQAFGA